MDDNTAVMQETICVEHCGSMLYEKKEEENMVKTVVVSHGIDVELQTSLKYSLPRFVTNTAQAFEVNKACVL